MPKSREISEMVDQLLAGDRKAAAKLMTIVENEETTAKSIPKKLKPHIGRDIILVSPDHWEQARAP